MRKSRAKKRILLPDPKFGDKLVTRFVNCLMISGNKQKAFRIFYNALDLVKKHESIDEDPLVVWKNHFPILRLKLRLEAESRWCYFSNSYANKARKKNFHGHVMVN